MVGGKKRVQLDGNRERLFDIRQCGQRCGRVSREAAALLLLLEEKAGDDGTVSSPELAAIRSILESCAKDLNDAFQEV